LRVNQCLPNASQPAIVLSSMKRLGWLSHGEHGDVGGGGAGGWHATHAAHPGQRHFISHAFHGVVPHQSLQASRLSLSSVAQHTSPS